ncbi:MAG: hypothetical protein COV48_02205 [Elusimicrobia bacterium CG11_big_fil_rev_8_21_14_0_20_64_6]|nr:MAG: hypothetical protein COV48_02205 [Elusimicrobia bacterium CG11_big_fil_rev_8_21_14_0_20_64_6]
MNYPLAKMRHSSGIRWLCLAGLLPLLGACRREPPVESGAALTESQKDRKQLVLQPKKGWKPQAAAPPLKILLLIDKTIIRQGESFKYRLEMQNTGREPLPFREHAPSFTKDGELCGDNGYKFYVTPPAGRETVLPCRAATTTDVRVSTAPAEEPQSGLDLTLQPGEYLLTRGVGPKNRFRELKTSFAFKPLGTYTLKVLYASPGGFRSESNTVSLEVVP